ncbi:MAG: hypothetical protein ACRCUY_11870 [Thermoguttaceae bacterium]
MKGISGAFRSINVNIGEFIENLSHSKIFGTGKVGGHGGLPLVK